MTTPQARRPTPRLVPVPEHNPPFDDELDPPPPPSVPLAGGRLALALPLPLPLRAGPLCLPRPPDDPACGPPPRREPRPLRLVTPPGAGPYPAVGRDGRPRQSQPTGGPPPVGPWTAQLLQAVIEVLDGGRPIGQLARWTTEEVYLWVAARAHRRRPAGQPAPLPRLRTLRLTRPTPYVVEGCAVLSRGERASALAFRLEVAAGAWVATALQGG